MKVSVSIVSFNTREMLKSCLMDILGQSYKDIEVWVVDNCSSDNSAEMVERRFSQVHLVRSGENGGFAKGHNQSLRMIRGDLTLILNPDTKLPKDAVAKMVEFFRQNPNCGVAGCKIVGFDNRLQPNGGDLPFGLSLISWLFNLEMLPFVGKLLPNFHRMDKEYYSKSREVGWVGGTFMMVRSRVFKKAGLLNENYFMYFEDVDFCYKVQRADFKVMLNPEVVIQHASGASSKDPKLAQFRGEMVGLKKFYRQHFGLPAALIIKLLIYLSLAARILAFAAVGKVSLARVYLKTIVSI